LAQCPGGDRQGGLPLSLQEHAKALELDDELDANFQNSKRGVGVDMPWHEAQQQQRSRSAQSPQLSNLG
jgi:hypothetical protein